MPYSPERSEGRAAPLLPKPGSPDARAALLLDSGRRYSPSGTAMVNTVLP